MSKNKTFCPNCKKQLSCGCQKTLAIDGRECCDSCVGNYNLVLIQKRNGRK
jgi:hypothetical protein